MADRALDNLVAFRVDAGPAIGMGHLRRCLTLAAELGAHGFSPYFICEHLAPNIATMLSRYPVFSLDVNTSYDEDADARATIRLVESLAHHTNWIIVDHYSLGERWEQKLHTDRRILVIDDFRERRHHADLLVSDTSAPFDPAKNGVADACVLAGRAYALIDPAYRYLTPSRRSSGPKSVLITYGGSDPTNETLKAIEAIGTNTALRKRIGHIEIVVGAASQSAPEVHHKASTLQDFSVRQNLPILAPAMHSADLILTAGGNTLIEALALRKPCVVTITASNQNRTVTELAAEKAIYSLGDHTSVGPQQMGDKVVDLLDDYDAFVARIEAKPLFDHLGAARIVSSMIALSGQKH